MLVLMWSEKLKMGICPPFPSKFQEVPRDCGPSPQIFCICGKPPFFCSGKPWRPQPMNSNQCPVYKEEGQHTGKVSSVLPGEATARLIKVLDLASHRYRVVKKGSRCQRSLTGPTDTCRLDLQLAFRVWKQKINFACCLIVCYRETPWPWQFLEWKHLIGADLEFSRSQTGAEVLPAW